MEARPHPGHVHVLIVRAELADEQRPPHHLVDLVAIVAPQPGIGRVLLQLSPRFREPQIGADQTETGDVHRIETGESNPALGRIERDNAIFIEYRRDGAREKKFVPHADLVHKTDNFLIGCEQVMVELLQRPFPALVVKTGSQAAGAIVPFDQRHFMPGAQQVIGGRQAGDARADDNESHARTFLSELANS